MTFSKQTLAIVVTGLASLTWVGVSAAVEGDDPVLDDQVEILDDTCPVEGSGTEAPVVDDDAVGETDPCAGDETGDGTVDDDDTTVDDDTTDDGTVDDDTTDDGTVDDDTADDGTQEHPENHGRHVSEAARETCPPGPGHGQCVRAVAQSDAGKADADATDDDEATDDDDADEDADDDEATDDSTDDGADDGGDVDDEDADDEDAPAEGATAGNGNGHR